MKRNDTAFPSDYESTDGLTKREWMATHVLASMASIAVAKIETLPNALDSQMDELMVKASLILTDKLIAELSKTENP